jgi:hypothetical protein
MHWTRFEIPRTISIVVVLALFAASAVYAVRKERKRARKSAAERVFEDAAKADDEGAR